MPDRPEALVDGELQDLIGRSYQMVLNKAGLSKTAHRQNRARTPRKGLQVKHARKKEQAWHAGPRK